MISCVAVVSSMSDPLFMKAYKSSKDTSAMGVEEKRVIVDASDSLKYHFVIHGALDVVEEKLSTALSKGTNDFYLGLLTMSESEKVYGFVTNTKTKFIAIVDESESSMRENDIKAFFRKVHGLYVNMLSNAFYTPGDEIVSKKFTEALANIVQSSGSGSGGPLR